MIDNYYICRDCSVGVEANEIGLQAHEESCCYKRFEIKSPDLTIRSKINKFDIKKF